MSHWKSHWSNRTISAVPISGDDRQSGQGAAKRLEETIDFSSSDRLLNTDEAALWLRLSRRTLERYRVTGGGPRYIKLGPGKRARVVYRHVDLIAWMDGSVFNSTAEYDR